MKSKEEKDKCILCGEETPYKKNEHIDFRDFYIYGVGQLCRKCFDESLHERVNSLPHSLRRSSQYID